MRKKHGSVPKLHTRSGLDSHNERTHWHSKCHCKRDSGSVPEDTSDLGPAGQRPLQRQPWPQVNAVTGRLLFAVPLKGCEQAIKAKERAAPKRSGRSSLPSSPRMRGGKTECCILAGQQQFAFPGMTGGRLRRSAGGRLPPPEAGRGGGSPTRTRGRAPARLDPRPSEDDEHTRC